jgi:hypothetical protein
VSRRALLLARGGSGSFTPSAPVLYDYTPGSVTTVINDSAYNAFPGLARLPGGDLIAVYRAGVAHIGNDGVLKMQTSTDGGATWSSAVTFVDDPSIDVRDPEITRLSDGTLIVTFFDYATVGGAGNFYSVRSTDDGATWDTPVAMGSTFTTYEFGCAPIVELPDGTLIAPMYGNVPAGDYVAFLMKSTDGGNSWGNQTTIASGGGHDWTEPTIVRLPGGDLHCLIRVDDLGDIYRTVSSDDGATWSTPAFAFDGISKVGHVVTASGQMIAVYRPSISDPNTVWRQSDDLGVSWTSAASIDSGGVMNYASLVLESQDVIRCVYAIEVGASNGDVKAVTFTGTPQ